MNGRAFRLEIYLIGMNGIVGILAYGSLITDPGDEIKAATSETKTSVTTPFRVEFARSSRERGGAPTLVPIEKGGACVEARIFVVSLPECEATDILYRREINKVGTSKRYRRKDQIDVNTVQVERLTDFPGFDVVLYTKIAANIEPLTAQKLAGLAISSVKKAETGRDGISYLIATKEHGIRTPLSGEYEAEILRQSCPRTLEGALAIHSK